MFLGGTQFRLPDTFAYKVIYQVELRYRDALRTVASELSLSHASLSQMSNTGVSVVEVKRDKAARLMIGKRMESSYFSSYFEALRPKSNIFTKKHANPNTEPRSCGCDTCQIVMNAGIDRDLNTAAIIPFSISGIRTMEEYDAMFDSMLRGHSSPRTPRSPSPRRSPTYSSKRRHTRSRNPSLRPKVMMMVVLKVVEVCGIEEPSECKNIDMLKEDIELEDKKKNNINTFYCIIF
jgi:hypothetical protein